jgi:hypothetical protein
MARRCHGAKIDAGVARPPPETSANPLAAAASAFSLIMRLYSASEHLFSAISSERRAIVSHDASISSVIIVGRDTLRRPRAFITNAFRPDLTGPSCGATREIYNRCGTDGSSAAAHFRF